MINYELLKQASTDVSSFNSNDFVKTAGTVRRLLNWFKQLSSEEYRQKVEDLKNESAIVKSYMNSLSKQLARLQNAIKDADVKDYEEALEEVKYLSKQLSDELDKLNQTSNEVEVNLPPQESNIPAEQINQNVQKEIGNIHGKSDMPFKNFERFANLPISFSDAAKFKVIEKLPKDALIKKDIFIKLFEESIKNGIITQVYPVKKEGREQQYYITVKIAPFSVPELPYKFDAHVLLNEVPGKKLSVMRVVKFEFSNYKEDDGGIDLELEQDYEHMEYANLDYLLSKYAFASEPVPKFINTLSDVELANVLRKAYQQVFGKDPTVEVLGVAWSQIKLETGGRLVNNNLGNVTASSKWINQGGKYFIHKTKNKEKGGYKEFDSKGNVLNIDHVKYRSYDSPIDGAVDYWKVLKRSFSDALSWFATGDALHSGLALGDKTYYTANRIKYSGGMLRLYDQFIDKIFPQMANLTSNPAPPPELKPEFKPWKDSNPVEIPKEFLASIKKHTIAPSNKNQEVGELMNYLFAAGEFDSIVKTALENKLLSKFDFKVKISSYYSSDVNIKFALALKEIFNNVLNANAEIYSDNKNIEVSGYICGSKENINNALNSVCNIVKDRFEEKYKKTIKTSLLFNKSILIKTAQSVLDKNEKLFHLREVV